MNADNEMARTEIRDEERRLVSPDEIAAFEERFLRLLERRTMIFTMGESTSVPRHIAADLLRSVSFVLGIDPARPVVPQGLIAADLEDEFQRRLAEIERKVGDCGELWLRAVSAAPAIPSVSLRDTLAAIGDFPRVYDFRSMAHDVPVLFDYPLCHPVPETLLGVDYINEYLRRLLMEADLLRRFDARACIHVLQRVRPGYEELPVNLYEPVATNAIGLALVGKDPAPLRISDADREEIIDRLSAVQTGEAEHVLCKAAVQACDEMGVCDVGARTYLGDLVPELLPRVAVGIEWGELKSVFAGT